MQNETYIRKHRWLTGESLNISISLVIIEILD